jgi:hypothetical protein
MRLRKSLAIGALALSTLAGCAGEPSTSVAQGPRGTWAGAGIDDYTITIERMCFCPDVGPYEVAVEDGEAVSVSKDGEEVPLDDASLATWPLTVDDLFAEIDEAERTADEVTVVYDATLGYPTRISIDRIEDAIDDEMSFVVRDLRVDA